MIVSYLILIGFILLIMGFIVFLFGKSKSGKNDEANKAKLTFDSSKVRILLVDDNDMNLIVLKSMFYSLGINNIVTLKSGEECISNISSGALYDIIFLDDMMPSLSGLETFNRLKEIYGFSIPTVLTSANSVAYSNILSQGFVDCVLKPVNIDELIN